jgi:hypothetical protein
LKKRRATVSTSRSTRLRRRPASSVSANKFPSAKSPRSVPKERGGKPIFLFDALCLFFSTAKFLLFFRRVAPNRLIFSEL